MLLRIRMIRMVKQKVWMYVIIAGMALLVSGCRNAMLDEIDLENRVEVLGLAC
jgi:hypothetical protein